MTGGVEKTVGGNAQLGGPADSMKSDGGGGKYSSIYHVCKIKS